MSNQKFENIKEIEEGINQEEKEILTPEEVEWYNAAQYLQDKPDGTKLPYSVVPDGNGGYGPRINRPNLCNEVNDCQTWHSFYKFGNEIFRVEKELLGEGAYGRVKAMVDRDGRKHAVKTLRIKEDTRPEKPDSKKKKKKVTDEKNARKELEVLEDYDLSKGGAVRNEGNKFSFHMEYTAPLEPLLQGYTLKIYPKRMDDNKISWGELGLYVNSKGLLRAIYATWQSKKKVVNSFKLDNPKFDEVKNAIQNGQEPNAELITEIYKDLNLQQCSLSNEDRFHRAIAICLRLHEIHTGERSKSKTPRVHGDLKPANMGRDIPVLDFGLAQENPRKKVDKLVAGSPIYMPCKDRSILTAKSQGNISLEQGDMLALKRSLFMPETFYSKKGYTTQAPHKAAQRSLLPKSLIEQYKKLYNIDLGPYIDTTSTKEQKDDFATDTLSAIGLAAMLIVTLYRLPYPLERVKAEPSLALFLTETYKKGKVEDLLQQTAVTPLSSSDSPRSDGRSSNQSGEHGQSISWKSGFFERQSVQGITKSSQQVSALSSLVAKVAETDTNKADALNETCSKAIRLLAELETAERSFRKRGRTPALFLFKEENNAACEAAKELRQQLNDVMDDYLSLDKPATTNQNIQAIIDVYKPVLTSHRGMAGLLDRLLTAFLAVISCSAAYFICKASREKTKTGYNFIKPETAGAIKDLADTFEQMEGLRPKSMV